MSASDWRAESKTKSYYADYAGNSCSDYPVGKKTLLFSPYDISGLTRGGSDWPPSRFSDFLDRAMIELIPDDYRKLLSE